MIKKYDFQVESKSPPLVELDSEAQAAYIHFSDHAVAETIVVAATGCLVTADLDAAGKLVGLELVGVEEFGLTPLLEIAGVSPLPEDLLARARYIPAPRSRLASV